MNSRPLAALYLLDLQNNNREFCRITAQLILSLRINRHERDLLVWINHKYASDPNLARRVNALLRQLEKLAG